MAENCPASWQNPTNIMRQQLLKRKNKALQARLSNVRSPVKISVRTSPLSGTKRSNPFKQSPCKKPKTFLEEGEAASDATLFKFMNSGSTEKVSLTNLPLNFSAFLSIQTDDHEKEDPGLHAGDSFCSLPVDWSLKHRIRFTSKGPFPWKRILKTTEEASGITSFVRCLSVTDSTSSMASIDTGANAQFHQRCLYWQHPSIPWLNLFPRSNKVGGSTTLSEDAQAALIKDWQESFRSAVTLVRACQCPYIYVCASNFVLLLRAAGIGGIEEMHALITPTTRGLRQLLTQEDVEFSMPFRSGRKVDIDSGYDSQESAASSAVIMETSLLVGEEEGDGASDWLEEMGLTASSLPALKSKEKTEMDKQREVDGFPESTVLIQGSSNILSLMNFLMSTKAHLSSNGPLAGIPPTILSPIAFNGATLKNYKVKQGESRVDGIDIHYFELAGPVLPSVVQSLCKLLKDGVHDFEVAANVLNITKPFAVGVGKEGASVFGVENLSDSGLNEGILGSFCAGGDASKWVSGFSLKQRKYRPGCL